MSLPSHSYLTNRQTVISTYCLETPQRPFNACFVHFGAVADAAMFPVTTQDTQPVTCLKIQVDWLNMTVPFGPALRIANLLICF